MVWIWSIEVSVTGNARANELGRSNRRSRL
jgi:hypothetical protein